MPLLASLSAEQFAALMPSVETLFFGAGEAIVRQGERADAIYLIKEGEATIVRRGGRKKSARDGSFNSANAASFEGRTIPTSGPR